VVARPAGPGRRFAAAPRATPTELHTYFADFAPQEIAVNLNLERRAEQDRTVHIGPAAITPAIDEDYWSYRVRLSDTQAIVGFPKFNTIGVGFAVEEDWNTNLPCRLSAETIFEHIQHNKGDDAIRDEDVLAAIELVRQAAIEDRGDAA
jgi:hypothetical protein